MAWLIGSWLAPRLTLNLDWSRSDAALIERADGGRFEIWGTWLKSGLTQSPFWGHGLGYLPETGTSGNHTPHNLLIQLVADSGLSGALMAALISMSVILAWRKVRAELLLVMAIPTLPILCYLQFGSVLFWPGGAWSSLVLILCVLILAALSGCFFGVLMVSISLILLLCLPAVASAFAFVGPVPAGDCVEWCADVL